MSDSVNNGDRNPPPAIAVSIEELATLALDLAGSGGRKILGICGSPGAGKSTVSSALLNALGDRAALVPMDGFHLGGRELCRLGRAERKGAPDTFDVDGYAALLQRLSQPNTDPESSPIYAPFFDRSLEEPIGSSIPVRVDVPLVITEGNYLLLSDHGWGRVRPLLDEAWFLEVDPSERRRRLISRRMAFGEEDAVAAAWVERVDEANAAIVEETRQRADRVFTLVHADLPGGPPPTPHWG